jgi:carbon monoxide dehydrogenase subunit G
MELTESFTVPVPADRLWEALVDVERIAPCVPGFTLKESNHPDYRGLMKVKVGAITVQYDATITFLERDDAARRAVLAVRGKELRGAGSVDATVTSSLVDEGERTTARMVTDVKVTGRVAQFGRGIIAEVSGRMTEQFVERLNERLLAPVEPEAAVAAPEAAAPPEAPEPEAAALEPDSAPEASALDLGSVAAVPVLKRVIPAVVALALLLLVVRLLGRRAR